MFQHRVRQRLGRAPAGCGWDRKNAANPLFNWACGTGFWAMGQEAEREGFLGLPLPLSPYLILIDAIYLVFQRFFNSAIKNHLGPRVSIGYQICTRFAPGLHQFSSEVFL